MSTFNSINMHNQDLLNDSKPHLTYYGCQRNSYVCNIIVIIAVLKSSQTSNKDYLSYSRKKKLLVQIEKLKENARRHHYSE